MRSFILALQFLTRLPIPVQVEYTQECLVRGTVFFPVVGLVLGGILCGLYYLFRLFLPTLATGALLLGFSIYLTGGMHLDGLMDTADGFGSGRPREKMLEIMRDSRVGAMGVIAGFTVIVVKFSLFASLPANPYGILLLAPVLSRFGMVYAITMFPYGRSESGLGKPFVENLTRRQMLIAGIVTGIIAYLCAGINALVVLLIFLVFLFLFCVRIAKKLGGLTGDTYGAVNELGEVLVLLLGIAFSR